MVVVGEPNHTKLAENKWVTWGYNRILIIGVTYNLQYNPTERGFNSNSNW